MPSRDFDAICIDLDGTLVTDQGSILPRTIRALRAADERGVRVMIATGRSEGGTVTVLDELGLLTPAVVYNGAGIWCPREKRMIEERVLSNRVVSETLLWAEETSALAVVMQAGAKFVTPPRTAEERDAISQLEDLSIVPREEIPTENLMRITLFSSAWECSRSLHDAFLERVSSPVYLTHFPLSALVQHRDNALDVVDVQPPCRGKGEALRYLQEQFSIPPERVVCVGDAGNDVPMMNAAGLAVAMENAFEDARAAADRIIGDNNTEAIAELVEELFLDGAPQE